MDNSNIGQSLLWLILALLVLQKSYRLRIYNYKEELQVKDLQEIMI